MLLEGEENPVGALRAFCVSASWRGKIRLSFLGHFFAWSSSLPSRRSFNDQGAESTGSDEVQKWSVLAGGARIPQRWRVAVADGVRLDGVVWGWPYFLLNGVIISTCNLMSV